MVISNFDEMSSSESTSQLQGCGTFEKNFHTLSLISLPIPCSDVQLNDRLVESSQILKDLDRQKNLIRNNINCSVLFDSQNSSQTLNFETKKIKVLQCAFSPNYIACLLEDNRVCRIPYVLNLETCSVCDDSTSSKPGGNSSNNANANLSNTITFGSISGSGSGSSLNPGTTSGTTAGSSSVANNGTGVSSTSTSGIVSSLTARNSVSPLGHMQFMDVSRNRAHALRRRLLRNPRSRPLSNLPRNVIHSQNVPEELISQAQAVLTGRSRNVIIRELQRSNLDVNSAVNNLLSRDDDEIDEEVEVIAQEELMSLLDSSYNDSFLSPNNDSSGSVSGSASDAFQSSYIRSFRGWSLGTERININQRNRLLRGQNCSPNKNTNSTKKETGETLTYNVLHVNGPQEFWPIEDDRKFILIVALHSELIALTDKGQLCQWRWADSEPFKGQLADGTTYFHPKVPPLGLLQEKVTLLSASCVRASVVTKTGKLATWIDESIAPLVIKLEHVATANLFDGCGPQVKVRNLLVSSLMSAVQLSNGQVFWWGIPPYSQRMKHVEKIISGTSSTTTTASSKNASGHTTSGSSPSKTKKDKKSSKEPEIVQGSYVRMVSSPIYQEGAIAFSTASGIPKVGQLISPLWELTDKCQFRILTPTEIQARFQSSNSSIALNLRASSLTTNSETNNKCNSEMPPPPSPASSTCSDNSFQPSLPKRTKRTSSVYSSSTSVQDKPAAQPEAEANVEEWKMEDLVFVEDGKSVTKELGKVIKIDGNFVAVKFNFSSIDQNRDFDAMFEECRIVQKQDLVLVKSDSGQTTGPGKIFDFFQRLPKKISLPRDIQILTATLTNFSLHCIAKLPSGRCCYLVISVMTGKVDESYYMPNEFRPFNTTATSASSSPDQSLLKLYSAGETNQTTVIMCRDANGTIYPLEKNRFDYSISEPIQINLGPISNIGLGVYQMPPSQRISEDKAYNLLIGLSFDNQYLMPSILKPNGIRLQYALECMSAMPTNSHSIIYEMCDGNRNIFHAAVSACFPKKNKNLIDSAEYQLVPINNEDIHDLPTSLPHLETDEQNPAAHFVLTTLLNSPVLSTHLFTLLTARDFQGFTPFMLAVSGRAYTAAHYLFQSILKISKTMAPSSKDTFNELMSQMIYPKGSLPDHSPLYILCTNDTCSFTWTGQEHINQDIFECRTCGLVGSLCCCTECARTCHRGHDCKLKRTSPTAYCDCWEKCKCKALFTGSQITRFTLLEELLLNTDLVVVLNSRGENILLHLLGTALRQQVEQKQHKGLKPNKVPNSRGRGSIPITAPRTDGSNRNTPDSDLDPPKFARKALERIFHDWTAIKVMVLTGYRSWKAESNSDLNFYNGTASAFAYEEENYFLSRQDGTGLLDKFMHMLLTSQFPDLLKTLVDTIVTAYKQEKEDAEIVAKRFVRSIGRIYCVVVSEMNPSVFTLAVSNRAPSISANNDSEFNDYLNGLDIQQSDSKKNKSNTFISNCRKCLVSFGPLAVRELAEIAEALIAPVRNGTVKPSNEVFWLTNSFSINETSSAQVLDVPPSVYAHQRDFIDPNTVDLPNDTASAQGASSLQDVNVLEEFEVSQALPNDVDPASVSASRNVAVGGGDLNANNSQDLDDFSDDTSNQDDSSFLSNADNASVAQRSVVTGATAGSDVGMPPMLFDYESMNSNADEDDEEEEREEDDEDEERDDEGEEEGSSLPETDVNTDEENEQGNFFNSIRSNLTFSRNSINNVQLPVHSSSLSRRNGSQHIQWAVNQSGTSQNRRRHVASYSLGMSNTGHENDISIPSATVGLARNFGIMVRLASDMLSIARHGRVSSNNNWNCLNFSTDDIVELHNYVEERFAATWSWLISVMNSCEGHLRFGCAVTQRRGHSSQSSGASSNSNSTSSEVIRNDQERSNGYAPRRIFLSRYGESEIRSNVTANSTTSTNNSINAGNNSQNASNTINIDNVNNVNNSKADFLSYSMSLIRGHFDEHYDSLPVFDAYSYRHVAYVFDAFVFYIRGGSFMIRNENNFSSTSNSSTFTTQFGSTKRNDPFYQRPRSTLFFGCPSPDPFAVPQSEALPLSVKPHLLRSAARVEELFGVPRPANAEEAKAYLGSLPAQMSLSEPIDKRALSNNSLVDIKNSKLPSFYQPSSSSKPSVIVLAGTAKHEELSSNTGKKIVQVIEKKIEEFQEQNDVEFYFSNTNKFEKLLGRWRLSMEIFGKVFADDVGAEPLSFIPELTAFSIKEARFRRDIESFDHSPSNREVSLLNLERERHSLLKQTFEQLNQAYKNSSDKSHPISRFKVTFKDEPGEGTGVMRSFFSTFSEVVLSKERFTSMNWFDNNKNMPTQSSRNDGNSHFQRIFRRSQNYLRVNNNGSGVALIQRFITPDSMNVNNDSSSSSILPHLNLRVNAPPYRPSFSLSSPIIPDHINDLLGHRFSGGNAQEIHNRVMSLQPALASRITGMLLDLPHESRNVLLESDADFLQAVNLAVELINNHDEPVNSEETTNVPATPQKDDFEPLFYQPGPAGFYSPIAGKCTEARLNAFRNIGRIMGICLQLGDLCGITLNRHVIVQVLGGQPTWYDLAFFDHHMFESFRHLINDAQAPNAEELFAELDFRFSIDLSPNEGGEERDLIPDGRNVRVTPENVLDYVRAYSLYRMQTAQYPAIDAIRKGIYDILPKSIFRLLTPEDFRLMTNGIQEINVQTLQSYVTFINESTTNTPTADLMYFRRWFWWVIEHMTSEEKQDLMYFWTGSPALHSAAPEGSFPPPSVTIRPRDDNYFVSSNTCISRLYVPLYSSRSILRQKLMVSIKDKTFSFI